MRHIGLFEGIGGFSLAAEWMGWETIAWCEINPFCQKILKQHFPKAIGHGDIKTTGFSIYRGQCDIVTGGDPCQPSSTAGNNLGKLDPRFLWPEKFRAIKEILPRWVVNENVPGTISNGILDQKISDLESAGYTCWPPMLIPAGAIGSIHRRDRIWLVAHSNAVRTQTQPMQLEGAIQPETNKSKSPVNARGYFGEFIPSGSVEKLFTDESPLVRGNDGIPKELDAIAAIGNSIDPRLAYQLFQAIEQSENR